MTLLLIALGAIAEVAFWIAAWKGVTLMPKSLRAPLIAAAIGALLAVIATLVIVQTMTLHMSI